MTVILYILTTICSTGQSSLGKQYASAGGDSNVFNINMLFSGTLTFLVFGLICGMDFHFYTFLYGICYGTFLCISMYSGFKALALGPMALTSVIASFSLIIPVLFGITVFDEKLSLYNVIGIIFLLFAISILNIKREKGFSAKWFFFSVLTMLTNGFCSLVQKYHQTYFKGEYTIEFMLYSFFTALIILLFIQALRKQKYKYSFAPYGFFSGIANGVSNYITLYLAATEAAAVLFPMLSITKILTVWIVGRIIFKEKLKPFQIFGLILGIVSVILLKL